MDIQGHLIELLSDGEFWSGEALGSRLGVSRTAVWKQLQKLEALGLAVESVKGVGYRLPGSLDLLDAERIQANIPAECIGGISCFSVQRSVPSTNQLAAQLGEQAGRGGIVVLAEHQSSGRGRRGKAWVSPYGKNIALSIAWKFDHGARALEGLSLAVGVIVRRVLVRFGLVGAQLKWPNDIHVEQRKLGGILLEMTGDPAGECTVIVGIGLNLSDDQEALDDVDQPWTSFECVTGSAADRNVFAGVLISELVNLLADYQQMGFGSFRDEWLTADAFAGAGVVLSMGNREIAGTCCGVDDDGALLLKTDNGVVERFIGGELSVRRRV